MIAILKACLLAGCFLAGCVLYLHLFTSMKEVCIKDTAGEVFHVRKVENAADCQTFNWSTYIQCGYF